MALRDYQRGWYHLLWLHMARNGGSLPVDADLWRLAGAETRHFFDKEKGAVLACYESREVAGKLEIFSEGMLNACAVKGKSPGKKPRERGIRVSITSTQEIQNHFEESYANYPRHLGKRAAEKAFYGAVARLESQHTHGNLLECARFIAQRALDYKNTPAGKRGKFTPHMSTWLNRDSFLDDSVDWHEDELEEFCEDPGHLGRNNRGNCWTCGKRKR